MNPDEVIAEHGADALRLYEMFMGPLGMTWQTAQVSGVVRFRDRVLLLVRRDVLVMTRRKYCYTSRHAKLLKILISLGLTRYPVDGPLQTFQGMKEPPREACEAGIDGLIPWPAEGVRASWAMPTSARTRGWNGTRPSVLMRRDHGRAGQRESTPRCRPSSDAAEDDLELRPSRRRACPRHGGQGHQR